MRFLAYDRSHASPTEEITQYEELLKFLDPFWSECNLIDINDALGACVKDGGRELAPNKSHDDNFIYHILDQTSVYSLGWPRIAEYYICFVS